MQLSAYDRMQDYLKDHPEATARELAKAIGISRQRVYQIASSYGMTLRKSDPAARISPEAPILIGGARAPITHTAAGTVAELVAAADLVARGYQVYMPVVRQRGHDLIAVCVDDGRVLTVGVRSGRRGTSGRPIWSRTPSYSVRQNRELKSDITAVVVSGEPVTYEPSL